MPSYKSQGRWILKAMIHENCKANRYFTKFAIIHIRNCFGRPLYSLSLKKKCLHFKWATVYLLSIDNGTIHQCFVATIVKCDKTQRNSSYTYGEGGNIYHHTTYDTLLKKT